jgi:hypothetical protein
MPPRNAAVPTKPMILFFVVNSIPSLPRSSFSNNPIIVGINQNVVTEYFIGISQKFGMFEILNC